jgi:hypothetical protein
MPNRLYPAVCATRQPIPTGHATCARASDVDLGGGEIAHFCADGVLLSACLVDIAASEIGPRLDAIALAAGTDPPPPPEGGP